MVNCYTTTFAYRSYYVKWLLVLRVDYEVLCSKRVSITTYSNGIEDVGQPEAQAWRATPAGESNLPWAQLGSMEDLF
jgi:hypothetical protein